MQNNKRIIHCPNSTYTIVLQCVPLTSLLYNADEAAWQCVYSNWAYGLFAICGTLFILFPILLLIYCCVRLCHSKDDGYQRFRGYTLSRSVSLYPESARDLPCLVEDNSTSTTKQICQDKLYYPYPAYGTHEDQGSLLAYPQLTITSKADMPPQITTQNVQIQCPISHTSSILSNKMYISNSQPIMTTMLRQSQQHLHENHCIERKPLCSSSLPDKKSIQGMKNNAIEQFVSSLSNQIDPIDAVVDQPFINFTEDTILANTAEDECITKEKDVSANSNCDKAIINFKNSLEKTLLVEGESLNNVLNNNILSQSSNKNDNLEDTVKENIAVKNPVKTTDPEISLEEKIDVIKNLNEYDYVQNIITPETFSDVEHPCNLLEENIASLCTQSNDNIDI